MTKNEIADRLEALSKEMFEVATAMDYFGGFSDWAQHSAELMQASFVAEEWVEEIRKGTA